MNAPLRLGVNALFYLPGEVGGAETYLLETLRALARRPDAPTLVLFANDENEPCLRREFPAAEIVSAKIRAVNRIVRVATEQIRLPRLVRRARVDVLWSPGGVVPLRCHCPQVATIHDLQYKRVPADVSWCAARALDVLYPATIRHCAAIAVPSEFARREIVELLGAEAGRILVTGEGVDPAFGRPAAAPTVAGDRPYLLCVAHTYPHKNVAWLVRACNRLAAEIPHRLALVGQPQRGEPEVAAALRAVPPGRVVRFAKLPRNELIALYQAADWFVFPSLYEGFGLPVLEAMCAGAPVLAIRAGAIPEVGGECIRYVAGRDETALAAALRAALALPRAERARQIAAARARAAACTWDSSAAKLWYGLRQVAKAEVES